MTKIRTLLCLVDIKNRSFLTSCVFWFATSWAILAACMWNSELNENSVIFVACYFSNTLSSYLSSVVVACNSLRVTFPLIRKLKPIPTTLKTKHKTFRPVIFSSRRNACLGCFVYLSTQSYLRTLQPLEKNNLKCYKCRYYRSILLWILTRALCSCVYVFILLWIWLSRHLSLGTNVCVVSLR